MELMLVISTPESRPLVAGLAAACLRRGIEWGCFLTNDGVRSLEDPELATLLKQAPEAVVCEASWERFMGEAACPLTLGSQTQHSEMLGRTRRVLSL